MTNFRFDVLLSLADQLTASVADLHDRQTLLLRKGGENVVSLFQGCQYCSAAIAALAGVRTTLFNRPACPTINREGKMENEQTIRAWNERVEEMSKALGVEPQQIEQALLSVADLQLNQAAHSYNQAISFA